MTDKQPAHQSNQDNDNQDAGQRRQTSPLFPWAWLKAVNDLVINPPFDNDLKSPIEILPWLYLSNFECVKDVASLRDDIGVTHVLTTNRLNDPDDQLDSFRQSIQDAGISHYYVPGLDEYDYDMLGLHWDECHKFLALAKNNYIIHGQGKVVVHCNEGMNRSGVIVAAALLTMQEEEHNNKMDVLEVVRFLKEKRGLVLTNIAFQKQLCGFAGDRGRLGEKPVGYTDAPVSIP